MFSTYTDDLLGLRSVAPSVTAAGTPARVFRYAMNGSRGRTPSGYVPVGDTVRMRLINAGAAVHPMHLHGFYFDVDSRGDERADSFLRPAARRAWS